MSGTNDNRFSWRYAAILIGAQLILTAAVYALFRAGLLPEGMTRFGALSAGGSTAQRGRLSLSPQLSSSSRTREEER